MSFLDFIQNATSSSSYDMAIDLGTANTLVAITGQGIVINEPSVVAIERSTHRVLAVGHEAKNMINHTPDTFSAEHPLHDVQVAKARTALRQTGAKEFCLGGGVAANPELRHAYEAMCHQIGVRLTMPPLSACTDNAAMIALVALDRYKQGKFFGLDCDVKAHAPLDEAY